MGRRDHRFQIEEVRDLFLDHGRALRLPVFPALLNGDLFLGHIENLVHDHAHAFSLMAAYQHFEQRGFCATLHGSEFVRKVYDWQQLAAVLHHQFLSSQLEL